MPRITAKSINGKSLTIDGIVIITLLYGDKDGNFSSYEYQYPFSKNIDFTADLSDENVIAKIKCDYINCRAVTGRKIDIHGAASIYVKVFKRKCSQIISDIDDSNVEVRRISTPATVPMGYSEKYLILEEDIRIGQGQPQILSVLKVNSAVCVKETKVINEKVVVKGEMTVSILYNSENSKCPQSIKTVIPYSQIVDMDGVSETCECECKSEIASLEVKPKTSATGEVKSFSLSAKILLMCEAYCGNDIQVVSDAFSRKYEADIKRENLSFQKISCNVRETYNCKKNIELDTGVGSVIDLWCETQANHTKFEDESMIIDGTLVAGIIYDDESGKTVYLEKPIDFTYEYPYKAVNGTAFCDPEIEVLSSNFTIVSPDNVEIRAELGINASIYEKNEISLVTDMMLDEEKPLKRTLADALIVYYAETQESVWDIANKFGASVGEIMSVNEIEDDVLDGEKMILIPLS